MARTRLYPPSVDPGFPELPGTPQGWIYTTFGRVLEVVERPLKLNPDSTYRLVTARRNRGGITLRREMLGREILTKTQFEAREGDFLISRRQIIHGACGVVPSGLNGAVVSNEYSTLRTRPSLLMEYLRHYCHSPYFQRTCFHSSHGVDVEKMIFKIDEWMEREVAVPPLGEQRKIAAILSSVDDATEATQAVIGQLQVVRKAMMAELLTRGLPGRHTRFKQTEIGEVPDDWEVIHLNQVITGGPVNGLYKPASKIGRGTLVAGMTAIDGTTLDWTRCRRAELDEGEIVRFGLRGGDLLVTRVYATIEGIGRFIIVPELIEPAGYESNMMRLRLDRSKAIPEFVAAQMALGDARRGIEQRATLGAQASINNEGVRRLRLRLPSLPEQAEIVSILDLVGARIAIEQATLAALRNTKSALMSALLTGEVRVTPDEAAA